MIDNKTIGIRINTALAARNKMQKELAAELKVKDNTISYFCSGKRIPNVAQIIQIAQFLDTTPDYLLGFSPAISADAKERATEEHTGLSLDAIKRLREALLTLKALGGELTVPNWFFSSGYFFNLIAAMEKYRINAKETDGEPQFITLDSGQQNIYQIMKQAAKLEMIEVVSDMTKDIDSDTAKG